MKDIGCGMKVMALTAAAKSFIEREGLGSVHHIDETVLWLQEKYIHRRPALHAMWRLVSPADLMTRNMTREGVEAQIAMLDNEFKRETGRKLPELYVMKKGGEQLRHRRGGEA